jgi:N-acetylneuraminic acid mutarotase
MPTPRFGHAASVVDGKIYLVGGAGPGGVLITAIDVYDPITDSWTSKADIPTGRSWLAAYVVDDKIYTIGGVSGSAWAGELLDTVEMYDPATDTWTTKANLPAAREVMAAVVLDGKIFVIGGKVQSDDGEVVSTGRVEVYDPVTDSWSRGKNMPISMDARAVVAGGKIYVTNGGTGQVYDPTGNRWAAVADIPGTVDAISMSEARGIIVTFGGININTGFPVSSVFMYDHESDTWAQLADMPLSGWGFSASEANGKVYLIGGLEQHWEESYYDPQPFSSVWEVSIDT